MDDDALYFQAYLTRQKTSALRKDFESLPEITGKGRFLGEFTLGLDQIKQILL